jgi:hypothetical protein
MSNDEESSSQAADSTSAKDDDVISVAEAGNALPQKGGNVTRNN